MDKANYLKELKITGYSIDFDKEKTEYSLKLPKKVNKLEVIATAKDENSKVEIIGADDLKENSNRVTISVSSSDGVRWYTINIKRSKKLLFLIIFAALLSILLTLGFTGVINDLIVRLSMSAPVIETNYSGWNKKALVRVVKDSTSNWTEISHYVYCVADEESTTNCTWQRTDTKNAWIVDNGQKFVYFRGVDINGIVSGNSNMVEVFIDNINPVISEVSSKLENGKIVVYVTSDDYESGVASSSYSFDDNIYSQHDGTFSIDIVDGHRDVYIKVIDNAMNETKLKVNTKELAVPNTGGESGDNGENGNEGNNGNNGEEGDNGNEGENGNEEDPNETEDPVPIEIPVITLDKVPSVINYGDNYSLPSYVSFGSDTGTYACYSGTELVTNTTDLSAGSHTIICSATSSKGITVTVTKQIEVQVAAEDEEVWDGYIILTLYYPRNSYDWQWRLGNENSIRTGQGNDSWQDYTGPIMIKLEDVSNVYIRYKIDGISYIIPPSGKALVEIQPDSFSLLAGETTTVNIIYDENADTKEYKVGTGDWQAYTGEFEVGHNTLIEARVAKTENIYNSDGEIVSTQRITNTESAFISEYLPPSTVIPTPPPSGGGVPGGGDFGTTPSPDRPGSISTPPPELKPDTYLAGPTIDHNPKAIAVLDSVTVDITTAEPARTIYYSISGGVYQVYTSPFDVSSNVLIRSYYVRDSDGKTSDTSYHRVQNIRKGSKPYATINASPDPYLETNNDADFVEVTITGQDYDTLEYSFDGTYYQPYTSPFILTRSATVYAKATNVYGTTYEQLTISNLSQPPLRDDLAISIIANPNGSGAGLIEKTTVTIVYDERADTKLYRIGSNGAWLNYTAPFEVTDNTTIYAHATSATGRGNVSKPINFLYGGLTAPIIKSNSSKKPEYEVRITISYDTNSTINRYSINGGDYIDYTEPFTVAENGIIEAYSEDALGNVETSTYTVQNIVDRPTVVAFERDMYYLIKLNYPEGVSSKEYKWTSTGDWKPYPEDGILLIKPEYVDKVLVNGQMVIQIEDENGKLINFNGDYYLLTMPPSQMFENLFMRWDNTPPEAPQIVPSTTDYVKELSVMVNYPKTATLRQYRIVYSDGTMTKWTPYTEDLRITTNNTTIYARYHYYDEVMSDEAEYTVINIDTEAPELTSLEMTRRETSSITVRATAKDSGSGVKNYHFKIDDGEYIVTTNPEYAFRNLKANTQYKITAKVEDGVGLFSEEKSIERSTNNIVPPTVTFTPSTDTWSTNKTISITHTDSTLVLEYSLNGGNTWIEYTGLLTLTNDTSFVARATDGLNQMESNRLSTLKIDNTAPELIAVDVAPRSSRLIATATALDNESGLARYYFSLDGTNYQTSANNYYTFSNLNHNTPYDIYVKVENGAGLMSEVMQTSGTTAEITTPVYGLAPAGNTWSYEKTLTIEYPEEPDGSYQKQYSTDSGATWKAYSAPILIETENVTVMARVIDGPNTVAASSLLISKIDRTEPTIDLSGIPEVFETGSNYAVPTSFTVNPDKSGGSATCDINGVTVTSTSFLGQGVYTINCTATTGAGRSTTATKDIRVTGQTSFVVDSILQGLETLDNFDDVYYTFKVQNEGTGGEGETTTTEELYKVHIYEFDGDQVWSENMTFGDALDVATASTNAQNMVVVKVNGNLTINSGVKVTTYNNEYGGPKGFTLYVTGELVNNGEISMTARGAKAPGQDVYLYKNSDATYEYVPSVGGAGGASVGGGYNSKTPGLIGINGTGRMTGGGGSGGEHSESASGSGATGTAYSGGSGGSGGNGVIGTAGAADGGAGGRGLALGWYDGFGEAGGGAGNPGGNGERRDSRGTLIDSMDLKGEDGTGGLLNIYANNYVNNGIIASVGAKGGGTNSNTAAGGSSGGGSVNIFLRNDLGIDQLGIVTDTRYQEIKGNTSSSGGVSAGTGGLNGGPGGSGTVNIGKIIDGKYYDLKEAIEIAKQEYIDNNEITINEYFYTGGEQQFTATEDGQYTIELWGASGNNASYGGKGGYTKGNIQLNKGEVLYLYVGQSPTNNIAGWNGGGGTLGTDRVGGGGGATDVRLANGAWNDTTGLRSRIMVAAGGGGYGSIRNFKGGAGGGLLGTNGSGDDYGRGATQTAGGSAGSYGSNAGGFGVGANHSGPWDSNGGAGAGGGGYYGGSSAGGGNDNGAGGGGSSYISGHTGAVAITSSSNQAPKAGCVTGTTNINCSYHYSGKVFTNTGMIGGDETGHTGNGYARISLISSDSTEPQSQSLTTPTFTIAYTDESDETDEAVAIVAIDYHGGVINEYSVDNGESWVAYTKPIKVAKETTILARDRFLSSVVSSSTLKVTKGKK